MFNWGNKKGVKELEAEVLVANDEVVVERQGRIAAEIALSSRDSKHAAKLEEVRAEKEVIVAEYKREIQLLESDLDAGIEAGIAERVADLDKQAHQDRVAARKELRAEFGTELDGLKREVKEYRTDSAKNKGLYDGALLVIKALENQLKTANDLTSQVIKALPAMEANITTPSVVVGSNNKS